MDRLKCPVQHGLGCTKLLGTRGMPSRSFWFSPTLSNPQARQHAGPYTKPGWAPHTPPCWPPRALVSRVPTLPACHPVQGQRLSLDISAFHYNPHYQVCVINSCVRSWLLVAVRSSLCRCLSWSKLCLSPRVNKRESHEQARWQD